MRAVVAFLIAVLALAGCGRRERSNPFDPANPTTRGIPAGFAAIAGRGAVELRWAPSSLPGDVGFQLFRRRAGESEYRAVTGVLAGDSEGLVDVPLADGVLHEYRLYHVLSGAVTGLPAEDRATPGPRRPWVADFLARTVSRLSNDGRRVAEVRAGFLGPTALAVGRGNRRVWIADTWQGRVTGLDPDGVVRVTLASFTEPVAVAADPSRDDLWVCDQARDAVYHFTLQGAPKSPVALGPIDAPLDVAVDPARGTLWVCERGGNRVRLFSVAGAPLAAPALAAPSRVAVDSATGDAWVTSFEGGRAVRYDASGTARDTVAFAGPIGVAVDAREGRIWIADARAGALVALRRGGAEEFRVTGLPRVEGLALDPLSAECWATVPGLGQVVRVAPPGAVVERGGGFTDPAGIAIDPGP
uniref:Fibronectin type-III domain-containing protein n=1 Tax=Eiseniibacteriota bacterium TaxID=2212470 RepID=A0A832MLL5_UNCEI